MAILVKTFNVRVGENLYLPGDVITELDEQEQQRLVDEGHCEYPIDVSASTVTGQADAVDPTNVEEFAELNAAGQKAFLEKQKIEPGSNATERIKQYAEWVNPNKESTGDGSNDGAGPNTGLPE